VSEDLNTRLLIQRQQARIEELQSFLALLIVRHGYPTDAGFRIDMSSGTAQTLRAQLHGHQPEVVITYEQEMDMHVLDAMAII
jgi:hypothetical protein